MTTVEPLGNFALGVVVGFTIAQGLRLIKWSFTPTRIERPTSTEGESE